MNGFVRLAIAGLLAGCAHSETANVTIAPASAVAAQPRAPGALPQPAAPAPGPDKQQCSAKASCGAKAACAGRP